jgi:phage protein D/phage baseplate assembly protein gpV
MPGPSGVMASLYRIVIDGADLDPVEANFVHEIKITDWLRLPSTCALSVGYPAADEGNPYQALDDSKFVIGAEIEVRLGATSDRQTQPLFAGEIVTVEPEFEAGGASMVVRAYDRSHRMMRTRKQRFFTKMSISQVVGNIIGEHGFRADVKTSRQTHEYILQNNETDWEFVARLAQKVGFEFIVRDKTASFKPPEGSAPVELRYPDDLHAFRPRITAVQQVKEVTVRGFDLVSKRTVVGRGSTAEQLTEAGITRQNVASKFGAAKLEIAGQSVRAKPEADALAQAQLNLLANAYLAAEGMCLGNPKIKAGAMLKISGVGQKYSGTYRVAKAEHVLTTGGYVTRFANSAGEHTLLGQSAGNGSAARRIDSMIVGIVSNNKDPEAMGRVKLKLPALNDVETAWAPVLLTSAGHQRGLTMMPVPGEQVMVGFENGDPSFPYVLGSLFNGRDKPGSELAVDDGSFALKSDKKALIAAKEDITIRSDAGKLEIKINNGEVTENVSKGYTGEFGGAWKLNSKQGITIEAPSTSVTIKAPSITVDATTSLTLKGTTVDIKGSGMVNISGGMINIG